MYKYLVSFETNKAEGIHKVTKFTDEEKAKMYFNSLIKRGENAYFSEIKGYFNNDK